MLHHCQRSTWCSFKKGSPQGEASVLPSLPLSSLASLVFFILLLCAHWWLHLLLTSVSVIFYCMNVIVRCPECHQTMILHTHWKKLNYEEWEHVVIDLHWAYFMCYVKSPSLGLGWPKLSTWWMICVHTLFCGFRVTSAECSPAPGTTKCLGTSDIGHMLPHDWDTCSYATVVKCTYFPIDSTSEVNQTDRFYETLVCNTCNTFYWVVQAP